LLEDHDSLVAYSLAGTIALPSPYPATGSICIVPGPRPEADDSSRDVYLKVIHRVSYRLKISRLVALEDVRAILAPSASWAEVSASDDESEGQRDQDDRPETASPVPSSPQKGWVVKVGDEVRGLVDEWLKGDGDAEEAAPYEEACWLEGAIVYVPEAARVLMNVEVGMTAAESAEYYPPLTTRQGASVAQHPHMSFCEGRLPYPGGI
jgi:hypothetical protein